MIDRDALLGLVPGLTPRDLEHWIALAWVRPEEIPGRIGFAEIDVARVRLLVSLHVELQIDAEAVPVVLSLLDQLHDQRRVLRLVHRAIASAGARDAVAGEMQRLEGSASF